MLRPCYALIKITYFPGLVARVDGRRARLIRVTPDFGAVRAYPGLMRSRSVISPGR